MTTIQLPTGANGARILGFGAYRPRRRVTNDELAQTMDTNDEWIQARVGIAERRWAEPDETLVEMWRLRRGQGAGRQWPRRLRHRPRAAGDDQPADGDPRHRTQIAHQLGIPRPGAFDINAGCAGWCYALSAGRPTRSAAARRATSSSSEASG